MNKTKLKARPTGYKDIRFRSKSEAVFARCLDMSPKVAGWIYEPDLRWAELSTHPWDFSIVVEPVDRCPCCRQHVSHVRNIVVELKPEEPSPVYVDEVRTVETKFGQHLAKVGWGGRDAYIIYGSPWEPPDDESVHYTAIAIHDAGDVDNVVEGVLGITYGIVQQAKQYRFDLRK